MTRSSFWKAHVPGRSGLLVILLAAGCVGEDSRTANLVPGISRDSVAAIMGGVPPGRPDAYIVGGQYVELLMYRREGVSEGDLSSLRRRDLLPVVIVDRKLHGWGWEHWDSVAAAHRIPVSHLP